MDQSKIGRFIAQRRKEKGWLQREVAEQLGVSEKTVSKWECGNGLPEVVFMEPLCALLGISVSELLAGERIPLAELLRSLDVSRLELMRQLEFEQMKMRLYKLYGLEIESMEPAESGAGGMTYFVCAGGEKYVVKYSAENGMNHPEVEIRVCRRLLEKGVPACRFVDNLRGAAISVDETGRSFTVKHYEEGSVYDYHEAPRALQAESARMLGRIHAALKGLDGVPEGIGAGFFEGRAPMQMKESFRRTLRRAEENGDAEMKENLRGILSALDALPQPPEISRLTCGPTHGDYMISQLVWQGERIHGVIDFTCACRHPYVWEIFRSYCFMAPEVQRGEVDVGALLDYFAAYREENSLTREDIENAGNLFACFLAACNFYEQYENSLSPNRGIYRQQGDMAAGLLRWFAGNLPKLNARLREFAEEK